MVGTSLQTLPAEIQEHIGSFLDWIGRARCQMTCRSLYQNMRNDKKDEEEAYEFYYKEVHMYNYPFNYCPYNWSANFKVVTLYSLLITDPVPLDEHGVETYPCVVVTLVFPRIKRPNLKAMRKHLSITIEKVAQQKRQDVMTYSMQHMDRMVQSTNEHFSKQVEMIMIKEYVSVKFIKILRWFQYAYRNSG